jgi:hypothetical protein
VAHTTKVGKGMLHEVHVSEGACYKHIANFNY